MSGKPLDEDQHLVRYVRKNSLRRDENMKVIGINPDAFLHRVDEEYLSSTWLEFFHVDQSVGLASVVSMFRQCLKVHKRDGYAIGIVGPIKEACANFGARIRVIHEPDPPNDAHVAVRRVPKENEALRARLAAAEWSRFALDSDFT